MVIRMPSNDMPVTFIKLWSCSCDQNRLCCCHQVYTVAESTNKSL